MADQNSEAKTCSVCGQDCSKTQRTKDAKGNYICAACVERAKQTKQAQQKPAASPAQAGVKATPKAPAEGDNAFLLELGGRAQALEGGKQCPNCERVLNQNDRMCLGCGYDTQLGKKVRTKIEAAPKVKKVGGSGSQNQIVIAIVIVGLLGAAAWYYFQNQG